MNLNEESEISIPLRNVFGIISAILSAAWGYFELTQQVNMVEKDVAVISDDVGENTQRIERLRELEIRMAQIEERMNKDGRD